MNLFVYEEDKLIMISYFVKYGIILVKGGITKWYIDKSE